MKLTCRGFQWFWNPNLPEVQSQDTGKLQSCTRASDMLPRSNITHLGLRTALVARSWVEPTLPRLTAYYNSENCKLYQTWAPQWIKWIRLAVRAFQTLPSGSNVQPRLENTGLEQRCGQEQSLEKEWLNVGGKGIRKIFPTYKAMKRRGFCSGSHRTSSIFAYLFQLLASYLPAGIWAMTLGVYYQ